MKKIELKFKNCYGIGKLEHTFDFSETNTFLVYAPNGTMKTSLAKTLGFFAREGAEAPSDRLDPERTPLYEIKFDGIKIKPNEQILIVNPEAGDYDSSNKISAFVASKELKKDYDDIYSKLDIQKIEFIKNLKGVSKSTDCESEFMRTFAKSEKDTFFDILEKIAPTVDGKQASYKFRYNDIFDTKGNVKKFLEKNDEFLNQYIKSYESLISKSNFFKKSDNTFGTYQAGEILKSIEDNSFFDAGHSLELSDNTKFNSAAKLKEYVETEVSKIVNDKELKKIFDKVDKALSTNVELRVFKKVIETNNLLLVELKDYENFKKKVWLGYLNELKNDALDLSKFYDSQKEKLSLILTKAKKEFKTWEDLVNQFNNRFYVPFKIHLKNQEDVILKQTTANLEFSYNDKRGGPPVQQGKDALLKILSKGEQKAYYILQLLFDVESRRTLPKKTFIVFDDIADSFDYKNKYAIIEYMKDLHKSDNFRILILTHNFDFYRTVASRLYLPRKSSVLMATKNEKDAEICLAEGQYVNDVFRFFLDRIKEPKVFIAMIPFLRNFVEYTEGATGKEYETLLACLHIKNDSKNITVEELLSIWKPRFPKHSFENITFDKDKILNMLYEAADSIAGDAKNVNEISLENKIVLSIAIRLRAEEFMIKSLSGIDLNAIPSNQTPYLFNEYKKVKGNGETTNILDRVILMTPENIHLNAFMYEPLIDISAWHLISLYTEVKAL